MALKLTRTQWLICFVAALGFAFDIYELLMLPLIVRPALLELANVRPGTPEFNSWVGMLFFLPAIFPEGGARIWLFGFNLIPTGIALGGIWFVPQRSVRGASHR